MGVHVFPILNTVPIPSLWVIPVHQPRVPSIMHWTWTGDSFHIWQYTCFNAILPWYKQWWRAPSLLSLCQQYPESALLLLFAHLMAKFNLPSLLQVCLNIDLQVDIGLDMPLNWLILSLAHIIVGLFIFFWLVGLVAKLSPTLAISWTVAPPGSPVHGISQARILEWVAILFSRGSSQPREQTCVSCVGNGGMSHKGSHTHV